MFKVNNKDTRMGDVLISIVNLEQVNVGWVMAGELMNRWIAFMDWLTDERR